MSSKNKPILNNIIFCERRWLLIAAVFVTATLFTALWAVNLSGLSFHHDDYEYYSISPSISAGSPTPMVMQPAATDIRTVQALVTPAIVHIHDLDLTKDGSLPKVMASGVIVHPAGYIATSSHSLMGLKKVKIDIATSMGIKRYTAKVISIDPTHDLALLKMNTTDRFMYLKLANKSAMQEGVDAYAFGFGVKSDVIGKQGTILQRGVVKQVGRQNITRLFSTDAVYSWEQTGGALVNAKGELLGLNLALVNSSGFVDGYAVPAHQIQHAFANDVDLKVAVDIPGVDIASSVTNIASGSNVAWMGVAAPGAMVSPMTGALVDPEHKEKAGIAGYSIEKILGLSLLGLMAGITGGMMTMGGGIIMVTGMFVVFGYGMFLIRPVCYLTNLFTYGASSYRNWRNGLVMSKVVFRLTPFAVIGVIAGYFIGIKLEDIVVGYLIGAFAFLAAGKALHEIFTKHIDPPVVYEGVDRELEKSTTSARDKADEADELLEAIAAPDAPKTAKSVDGDKKPHTLFENGILGLPMGMVSGVIGVSGGIVEVPLQRYFANISLRNAIANSSVMVFWTSLSAAIVSIVHGTSVGAFQWQTPVILALIMIPSCYVGGMLGASLLRHVPANILRWIYFVIMLVVGTKMLFGQ